MTDRKPDLAPETVNREQVDEDAQAQTTTEAARRADTGGPVLGETEKVSTGHFSDDQQDLVDHMRQMDTSGRIDMDAFAGEPSHDDEDERRRKEVDGGKRGESEAGADEL
jgi:hypothetical protein